VSIGSVTNSGPLGKWSVTFADNTHVVLTTPGGATNSLELPADAIPLLSGPLYAYFGTRPNAVANIGQSAVFSKIEIAGTAAPLVETFTGDTLNPDVWLLSSATAADATGIVLVPKSSFWWIGWTTPAVGFVLQSTAGLATPSWTDIKSPVSFANANVMFNLLDKTNLPSADAGFFRLIKH
jgi:hypothetical protein